MVSTMVSTDQVENAILSGIGERSFVDKLLDRRDVEKIERIITKEKLTREDLLQLLYVITGIETKLVNYSEYDRYILGKYYAWIRDFVNVAELFYDVEQQIREFYQNIEKNVKDKKHREKYKEQWAKTQRILDYIRGLLLHDVKFAIDVFLFLSRSTLSLNAEAFKSLLTNKFEVEYSSPEAVGMIPPATPPPAMRRV